MKWYGSVDRWIALAGWTVGAAALGTVALVSAVTPPAILLVILFAMLMMLVQLRWQAAVKRSARDREQTLALLRSREQQLAQAQRIAQVGSFEWDVSTDDVLASPELWRIAGLEPEEVPWTLTQYMTCIHPDDHEVVRDRIEAALVRDEPLRTEVRLVQPDGSIRQVASSARVVRAADGRPLRLIGIVQDVTERWQAAAALERRVRIEQSVAQVAQLLAEGATQNTGAALRVLGEGLGAERIYLLQARLEGSRMEVVRAEEWLAPGARPSPCSTQGSTSTTQSWWMRQLVEREQVLIRALDELPPEATPERAMLEAAGLTSAAAVPLRELGEGLTGLLGLDYRGDDVAATEEDVRVLRTVSEMLASHYARERAEREIAQRDAILEAVSFMAERFLLTSEWQRDIDDALARLGGAAAASRAYLFASTAAVNGTVRVSQRAEWVSAGISPELHNPEMQNLSLADVGLERCEEALRRNEPVQELIRTLPAPGRQLFEAQGIRSVLLIPVFVGRAWWGVLGFDDCVSEREWTHTERDVLMTAGRIIGAGIQRKQAEEQLRELEEDVRRANRIEAIGHLAAGIAHEINTPIQYVGDNLRFLDESFGGMKGALQAYQALLDEARVGTVSAQRIAAVVEALERADIDYLMREAPRASAQALDGVQRVAEIVRAMKEFSHPGTGVKVPTDLNQAIRSTTTVARNEWKYVAELVTELDEGLPMVHCYPGELNQAVLNLVINAAHAIAERQRMEGSEGPGTITISTAPRNGSVEIRVRDTGTGIPVEVRSRIFDPFFTTKEVGRGTGQGLTFVHSIVVDKHGGSVGFETEVGVGTTFIVRLPDLPEGLGIGVAA